MVSLLSLMSMFVVEARAACPSTVAEIEAGVKRAEATYLDDAEAFVPVASEVLETARCAGEVVPSETVASVHTLAAMRALLERDTVLALAAVAGAKSADAGFMPSDDVAPQGSSLRRAFEGASAPPTLSPLPASPGVRWRIDGKADPLAALPSGRSVFVQAQDERSGAITRTWYLPMGGTTADLGVATSSPVVVAPPVVAPPVVVAPSAAEPPVVASTLATATPAPLKAAPKGRRGKGLLLGGSAAMALAGGAAVVWSSNRAEVLGLDTCGSGGPCSWSDDQLDALSGVHGLVQAGAFGAVALGATGLLVGGVSAVLSDDAVTFGWTGRW